MSVRVKRTYNLPETTVKSVREIADRYGASQDGVVELAVAELTRRIRAEDEERAWMEAAADPAFRAEMERLDADLAVANGDSWPQDRRPPLGDRDRGPGTGCGARAGRTAAGRCRVQ